MKLLKNNHGIAHMAVLLIFAAAAIGFVGYTSWNAWQANTIKYESKDLPAKTDETKNTDSYAGWKTYINTKYHFSFKYPTGASVVTFNSEGSESGAATKTSDTVGTAYQGQAKFVFSVDGDVAMEDLDESTIKLQFALTPSSIASTKIAGEDGYKVSFTDTSVIADFYFLKRDFVVINNPTISKITVSKTNSISKKMFASLKFDE